ncbi:MAG: nitroreductase family protein [Candidatus Devosia symbiotica]|nr:nitroreductase family protein [Candidatus Devosia symbiotica]
MRKSCVTELRRFPRCAIICWTRRSVGIAFLQAPKLSPDELEQMLTIAMRVPDHGKVTPWRLVLIAGEDRAKAGAALAKIAARNTPGLDEASLEIERQRFLPALPDHWSDLLASTISQDP